MMAYLPGETPTPTTTPRTADTAAAGKSLVDNADKSSSSTTTTPAAANSAGSTPSATTSPPVFNGNDFSTNSLENRVGTTTGNGTANIPLYDAPAKAYGGNGTAGSANAYDQHAVERGQDGSDVPRFTQQQAEDYFGTIMTTPDMLKRWRTLAVQAGLVSAQDSYDMTKLYSAWKQAVGMAAAYANSNPNGEPLSPWNVAQIAAQHRGNNTAATTQPPSTFTGDRTEVTKSIDNQPDTSGFQTLHDALGRNPSQSELDAYQKGWIAANTAHPQYDQKVTHYEKDVPTNVTDTYTGGIDPTQTRQDLLQSNPQVAKYQQATTYFDALKTAIAAAV